MKIRFHVTEKGRAFASVHAGSADEAIRRACRMTGRQSERCAATASATTFQREGNEALSDRPTEMRPYFEEFGKQEVVHPVRGAES